MILLCPVTGFWNKPDFDFDTGKTSGKTEQLDESEIKSDSRALRELTRENNAATSSSSSHISWAKLCCRPITISLNSVDPGFGGAHTVLGLSIGWNSLSNWALAAYKYSRPRHCAHIRRHQDCKDYKSHLQLTRLFREEIACNLLSVSLQTQVTFWFSLIFVFCHSTYVSKVIKYFQTENRKVIYYVFTFLFFLSQ